MTVIKAIHASARSLGLDEDALRDLYERETHKRSLKVMTNAEQVKVLDALRASGAQPVSKGRKALTGPYAKKLQALWISAWNLGIVRNRDDKAMLAFIERQTGIANTAFLRDPDDARKAIEALKKWLERDGGVHWGDFATAPDFTHAYGFKIACAQFRALEPEIADGQDGRVVFAAQAALISGARHISLIDDAGWRTVMNALGARIRGEQAAPRKRTAS